MASETYLRPREPEAIEEVGTAVAHLAAREVPLVVHVLEQEALYVRTYGRPVAGGLEIDADAAIHWIAERLRYKRQKVRSVLEAHGRYLRERGLIPPAPVVAAT